MPITIVLNGIRREINEKTLNLLSKEELCRMVNMTCDKKHKKSDALAALLKSLSKDSANLELIYKSHKELFGLSPYLLEETIGCTSNERKKWTKDGRLHVVGNTSFHKYGKWLEAPLYDRWQAEFIITADILQEWRMLDAKITKINRKTGAIKASRTAVITRQRNEKSRKQFAFKYNEMINEWSTYSEKEAALLELAYWTMWQNRWAKTAKIKAEKARKNKAALHQASEAHYSNKERALKLIVQSGMGELSVYRPENPDRIHIHFCAMHYDEVVEYFYCGYRATEIFRMQPDEYRNCPFCALDEEKDYYSLYYIVVQVGNIRFSFHTPFDFGKNYLPPINELPLVQHKEQEGMFRFGRGLTDDEMVTHTEKLSDKMFQNALDKFSAIIQ